MLLFKTQHVAPILLGRKTQTRRLWPKGKRVNAGSLQQCRTAMLKTESCFAVVRILRVWEERLTAISEEDAQAEGYPDAVAYLHAFARINRIPDFAPDGHDPLLDITCWCVEFEMVEDRVDIGGQAPSASDRPTGGAR